MWVRGVNVKTFELVRIFKKILNECFKVKGRNDGYNTKIWYFWVCFVWSLGLFSELLCLKSGTVFAKCSFSSNLSVMTKRKFEWVWDWILRKWFLYLNSWGSKFNVLSSSLNHIWIEIANARGRFESGTVMNFLSVSYKSANECFLKKFDARISYEEVDL